MAGKVAYSVPRYLYQRLAGWYGSQMGSASHESDTLFVAGLPKSGTSWLESMLEAFQGFQTIMPPQAVFYEFQEGGSHDYQISEELFDRLRKGRYVIKLHCNGSVHNARVLRFNNIKYVVLYRDLRDVAVSHYFYVRRTPWHPEYSTYRDLSIEDGLKHFAQTLLSPLAQWIRLWHRNADKRLSYFVRYEDLLGDSTGILKNIVEHFGIDTDSDEINSIIEANRFASASGGRSRGESDEHSFTRKGISGDWRNHFTQDLTEAYRKVAGTALKKGGYID